MVMFEMVLFVPESMIRLLEFEVELSRQQFIVLLLLPVKARLMLWKSVLIAVMFVSWLKLLALNLNPIG